MNHFEHPSEQINHTVNKAEFVDLLSRFLKTENILSTPEAMRPFDCDGMSVYQVLPWLVALPETVEQTQAILRLCHQHGVPIVARGAGTGLSGGALPVANGVLLSLAKFTWILNIDQENRSACVQPGVRNLAVSEAVGAFRFVLCARSFFTNRLHDRRQCGGKCRWRALSEVRADGA